MKYLCFEELEAETKTKKFAIKTKRDGIILGYVKWYSLWRRYCFVTIDARIIFDAGCLADIKDFIDKLMEERKHDFNGRKPKRG